MNVKSFKKGFTLTELIIVIVIIGILAGVLIPTFINVVNKANKAADLSLIRNLNEALALDRYDNGEHKHMTSALNAVADYGFEVEKIDAKVSKNKILWDSENDVFCYLNNGILEYYPQSVKAENEINPNGDDSYKLWIIASTPSDVYSTYLYKAEEGASFTGVNAVKTGIDTGKENISAIEYKGKTGKTQYVVIRTNSFETVLTIDAQSDRVYHYGELAHSKILAISETSYYEYGRTKLVEIAKGRVVITNEENANVESIYLDKATDNSYGGIILATMEGAELPDVICRDEIENPTSGNKTLIAQIQQVNNQGEENVSKTENIYLYGEQLAYEETKGYEDVSDLGTMILEAQSGTGSFTITINNKEVNVNYSDLPSGVVENKEISSEEKETTIQTIIDLQVEVTFTNSSSQTTVDSMSLAKFRDKWNNGDYDNGEVTVKLIKDFSLSGNWEPIGTSQHPFYGTIDGCDKTISGLTYSGSNYQIYGLIGYAGSKSLSISNLTLNNVSINNSYVISENDNSSTGALVGYINNTSLDVSLTNVTVNGSISGSAHVGGLVGVVYSTGSIVLDNCTASCSVTGSLGGLAGMIGNAYYFNSVTVKDCVVSNSSLTFNTTNELFLGDFVGFTPTVDNISKVSFDGTNTWDGNISITQNNFHSIFACLKIADFTLANKTINTSSMSKNAYKLSIENCTVGSTELYNFGDLTINGGTFSSIINNGTSDISSANMTISNGTFNAQIKNYGSIEIEGGTISNFANRRSATITGGSFPGPVDNGQSASNNSNVSMTVNGGTFTGLIRNYNTLLIDGGNFNGGNELYNFKNTTISSGTINYSINNGKVNIDNSNVSMTIAGGTFSRSIKNYGLLETTSGTFQTLYNFKNATISGGSFSGQVDNGKDGDDNSSVSMTINSGTFSSGMQNYGISLIYNGSFSPKVTNYGNLTIEGGTFNNPATTGGNNCIVNGDANYTSATLTIKSGSFACSGDHTIMNYSILTIEDGTFENTRESADKYCIYNISSNCQFTIKQYTAMNCTSTSGRSNYVYCANNSQYRLGEESTFTIQTAADKFVLVESVKKN